MTVTVEDFEFDEDEPCCDYAPDPVDCDCEEVDYRDECYECGGAGHVIPDHCCACGGSPYCQCCRGCGAECVGSCRCTLTVQLQDGGTLELPGAIS